MIKCNKTILIFSLAYDPFWGGAEIAVKNICERLSQNNYIMITANLDGKQKSEEKLGNIYIYRVGNGWWSKYLFPLLAYKKALVIKKQHDLDFIWAIMANQAGLAALFFKIRFPRIAYLLTLQEGDSEFSIWLRTFLIRPIYKSIYRKADKIQAISSFLSDRAKKMGASCSIDVIPNGVDTDRVIVKETTNNEEKIIITTSRLVTKNGLEFLIKAIAKILADGLSVKLKIIGSGKLKNKLTNLVKDLNIEKNVDFLGEVANNDVYKYLSTSDIFVRPSLSEGLGNSFLEAMAVGLPVVGTPVGGIVDFLYDGKTGWIVNPGDVSGLTAKLKFLINDKNLLEIKRVAENGKELVRLKYSWSFVAQSMNNVFNDLFSGSAKILFCTGIYPPEIGGPAIMIRHLVSDLEKKGFNCHVLTYTINKHKNNKKVTFVSRGKLFSHFFYFLNLFFRSLFFDIIYVTDTYSVGYFAWLLKKLTGKKYIVRFAGDSAWETSTTRGWTHDYIIDFNKKIYENKIERMKNRRRKILTEADIVIAVSNFMSDLAEIIGVNRNKIKVIYNSVDFIKITKDSFCELPKDGRIIMTACRLTKWKGVDLLIKVLPQIKEKIGNIYLVILGDGPEMLNLKHLSKKLKIDNNVIFLGRVAHDFIMSYYRKADVFVLNTNYEGLSHTLLEVMVIGVPIIATNVGGNPELIENEKNGLLINYGDEIQLRTAIIDILQNKERANRFVSSAIERTKFFNWDSVINDTVGVIKKII